MADREREQTPAPAREPAGEHSSATTVVELALAWTLVGVPLAWGVWQVFQRSLDLFR